jgi:UDP-GlcNAc:undecaprenyl-phosphate GlcNAc-1-phosphate transferase
VCLGVVDDLRNLHAGIKLIVQSAGVLLMIVPTGMVIEPRWIEPLANLVGRAHEVAFVLLVAFTAFVVVGMINAINMIDGMDGLAGGTSAIALICFAVVAAILRLNDVLLLALLMLFVVLGFLVFNFRTPWRTHAAVFMGDAGSMMLGFSLAFFAIHLSQGDDSSLSPVAALWICSLPVIDTGSLIVRRLAAGDNPVIGDRRHLHHIMLQTGLSTSSTVAALLIISMMLGAVGIAGWCVGISDRAMLMALAIPIGLHTYFVWRGWKSVSTLVQWIAANRLRRYSQASLAAVSEIRASQ